MHAEAVRNIEIRAVQLLVTDLAQRVEDANLNSKMSVSVPQQLADDIHFVVASAVCMPTLSTAALFEDIVDSLNVVITQIKSGRNVIGSVINE